MSQGGNREQQREKGDKEAGWGGRRGRVAEVVVTAVANRALDTEHHLCAAVALQLHLRFVMTDCMPENATFSRTAEIVSENAFFPHTKRHFLVNFCVLPINASTY